MNNEENFKSVKVSDLVQLLLKRNQDEQIAVYNGCAREFTSDFGWECSSADDSFDLQLFSKTGIK